MFAAAGQTINRDRVLPGTDCSVPVFTTGRNRPDALPASSLPCISRLAVINNGLLANRLLELDSSAGFLKLLLDVCGLVLACSFLDG